MMRRSFAAGLALIAFTGSAATAQTSPPAPPGMQYTYGSGEGAAISVQAWRALTAYARERIKQRPVDSVVLAPGASLAVPTYVPCGDKDYAAVFDVDETVLQNLGFEYDAATGTPFSDARWDEWERTGHQVLPVPGASEALDALRAMHVTIVFNTNRLAANAAANQAVIEGAGLGPARHGDTLYLKGDDTLGSNKDGRRAMIASRFCVIAMGGDQLGDFSNLFAIAAMRERRDATLKPAIAPLWGAGWFVLPNPVYGTGLKGNVDEVFPDAVHWPVTGEKG
jgi:5'-nucleotidase (lipoprotein e(P4) family)